MNIEETFSYIHKVKWKGMKPGLERTIKLLSGLGNPHKELKFVHIGGTNGKGSTAAYIAAVLQEAGYKTGLYISPYVICFNERMQVNGEFITNDELIKLTETVRPIADNMIDPPTEFELITAIAMLYYKSKACDIVVLEVGMGGKLDSTNVIDTPEAAVITRIGYDHVKELGPELSDIAMAKAGIIKGGDVVVYDDIPDVIEVFINVCKSKKANLKIADFSRISNTVYGLHNITFNLKPYGDVVLPLVGTYQPKNAVVAVTALEILRDKGYKISDTNLVNGLKSVKWPGRFEILGENPVFILDGAHNPQCTEAVAESLSIYFKNQKVIFIMGVMADKDIHAIVGPLLPFAKCFITVKSDNPRAMDTKELADLLSIYGIPVSPFNSIPDGVKEAVTIADICSGDVICALGSLYISDKIRKAYCDMSLVSLIGK